MSRLTKTREVIAYGLCKCMDMDESADHAQFVFFSEFVFPAHVTTSNIKSHVRYILYNYNAVLSSLS